MHLQLVEDLQWFGMHVPMGARVEARDELMDWCTGVVVGERRDAGAVRRYVRVRFDGWGPGFDEWVRVVPEKVDPGDGAEGAAEAAMVRVQSAGVDQQQLAPLGPPAGASASGKRKAKRRRVDVPGRGVVGVPSRLKLSW